MRAIKLKRLSLNLTWHLLITLIIYTIVYTIYTFIVWEFHNPFKWFTIIPTRDLEYRTGILFGWAIYNTILQVIIRGLIRDDVIKRRRNKY